MIDQRGDNSLVLLIGSMCISLQSNHFFLKLITSHLMLALWPPHCHLYQTSHPLVQCCLIGAIAADGWAAPVWPKSRVICGTACFRLYMYTFNAFPGILLSVGTAQVHCCLFAHRGGRQQPQLGQLLPSQQGPVISAGYHWVGLHSKP